MKKALLVLTFLPVLAIAQHKGTSFKLSGVFKNAPADISTLYLSYAVDGAWKTDSTELKDGKFKFSGTIQEPILASMRVKYALQADGKAKALNYSRDVSSIFLEKGKIKMIAADSISNNKVKKSTAHSEYTKLKNLTKPYSDKMEPLYAKYSEYRKSKDEEGMKKVESEIDAIDAEMKEDVYGKYAKENPNSPVALYAVKQYAGWDINPDKLEPVFNLLPATVQNLPSGIALKEQLEIAKKTGIGREAMDFTQNDTLGIPVTLSTFRGKYILIDFWASWCGPCRAENPNVVKAFQKYKDKGFHILSVSLDQPGQKEKWMKAIHDDKLEWTHVSDLKYWKNDVAVMYGIQAIPQNLLLGPDGKIVAKNLRGEDLAEKLHEFIDDGKKAF